MTSSFKFMYSIYQTLVTMAKVLSRFEFEIPSFENPTFKMERCKTAPQPIMDMLLKFGIGATYSTFRLPRFATPSLATGVFIKGGFQNGEIPNGVCREPWPLLQKNTYLICESSFFLQTPF